MVIFHDIQASYPMVVGIVVLVKVILYVLDLRETMRDTRAHIRVFVAMEMFAPKRGVS
jgi:hypothetical protein